MAALLGLAVTTSWPTASQAKPQTQAEPAKVTALRHVVNAMAPLCRPKCGRVKLTRDDSLRVAAQARHVDERSTHIVYNARAVASWSAWLGAGLGEGDGLGVFYVMAHEYGHHLDLHRDRPVASTRDPWPGELVADTFAGCALARAGYSAHALSRFRRLERGLPVSVHHVGRSHPPPGWWVPALREGYRLCSGRGHLTTEGLLARTRRLWSRPQPMAPVRASDDMGLLTRGATPLTRPKAARRRPRLQQRMRLCYERGRGP